MTCAHAALRRLRGGVCPVCDPAEVAARRAREAAAAELELAGARAAERAEQEAVVADALRRGANAADALARRWLSHFVRAAWHVLDPDTPLEWNWHHDSICRHVQYQLDEWRWRKKHPTSPRHMSNLVINVPPGTGKSRIISVLTNAWMWVDSPEWKVTVVSSNDAVVARDHAYFRRVITSQWYAQHMRPRWVIDTDNARDGLVNTAGGARLSRSFLAGAVGLRGDALLVDDADDPSRVKGEAYRAERDQKWDLAWYNRVNDERVSTRLAVQQRTDPRDHTAHLLVPQRDAPPEEWTWQHLCLPLHWRVGLPQTPIGSGDPRTTPGEVLHPSRFTADVIRGLKRALGTAGFELQYDQRDAPTESKYFPRKWWRWAVVGGGLLEGAIDAPPGARPEGCDQEVRSRVIPLRSVLDRARGGTRLVLDLDDKLLSVDASFGANKTSKSGAEESSLVGLGVLGSAGHRRYFFGDYSDHLTYPQMKRRVKSLLLEHDLAKVLIELKANGQALVDEMAEDPELSHVEVVGVVPTESKVSRATAHQPAVEDGAVYLVEGSPRVDRFVEDFAGWRGTGQRSDRVDYWSQAMQHWAGEGQLPWWMR